MVRTSNSPPEKASEAGEQAAQTAELQLIGQVILEHLQQESSYLDSVIDCSAKMTELLNQSSFATAAPWKQSTSSPADKDLAESLNRMRVDLANQFGPVSEGRREMNSVLANLPIRADGATSLRELAPHLEGPLRDELNRLRSEIRDKLREAQAITLGNQAVLIYTLDFYHRLMTGIAGEAVATHSYNANGQMTHSHALHLVEKKC
jgi:hypothetical protein